MRCRYGDKETNRQTHARRILRHREPKRPTAVEATPSNIRGCQSGTVRCLLLDRKILEEHLQNSNESMENKTKAKTTKKKEKGIKFPNLSCCSSFRK